jgi:hypothetical protein
VVDRGPLRGADLIPDPGVELLTAHLRTQRPSWARFRDRLQAGQERTALARGCGVMEGGSAVPGRVHGLDAD